MWVPKGWTVSDFIQMLAQAVREAHGAPTRIVEVERGP